MMAFVRGVILASTCEASMFQVSAAQSTRTGRAPARMIAAAQEIMVNVGRMTSSPGPMSSAATAASNATEPLATATPYLRPRRAANCSSKRRMNGPSEEIQPVSMHSSRYFFSLPSRDGSLTGIIGLPRSVELDVIRADWRKTGLVCLAGVGTLLDLDHFGCLQHLE